MRNRTTFLVTLVLLLSLLAANTVGAHTSTVVGPYDVVAAWQIEPPVVGERNTLIIDFLQNGRPVATEQMALQLTLILDDAQKAVAVQPVAGEAATRYNIPFIPTVAGTYEVHLNGTVGTTQFDHRVAPEPVTAADVLQFPQIALSNRDLQEGLVSIEQRQAQIQQQARQALIVAIVLPLVTLAVSALLLRRR